MFLPFHPKPLKYRRQKEHSETVLKEVKNEIRLECEYFLERSLRAESTVFAVSSIAFHFCGFLRLHISV